MTVPWPEIIKGAVKAVSLYITYIYIYIIAIYKLEFQKIVSSTKFVTLAIVASPG